MSLPNQVVYIQFHPVAYMVKLNIEMTMADLITKLASGDRADARLPATSHTRTLTHDEEDHHMGGSRNYAMNSIHKPKTAIEDSSSEDFAPLEFSTGGSGAYPKADGTIQVETVITSRTSRNPRSKSISRIAGEEDELPLAH